MLFLIVFGGNRVAKTLVEILMTIPENGSIKAAWKEIGASAKASETFGIRD